MESITKDLASALIADATSTTAPASSPSMVEPHNRSSQPLEDDLAFEEPEITGEGAGRDHQENVVSASLSASGVERENRRQSQFVAEFRAFDAKTGSSDATEGVKGETSMIGDVTGAEISEKEEVELSYFGLQNLLIAELLEKEKLKAQVESLRKEKENLARQLNQSTKEIALAFAKKKSPSAMKILKEFIKKFESRCFTEDESLMEGLLSDFVNTKLLAADLKALVSFAEIEKSDLRAQISHSSAYKAEKLYYDMKDECKEVTREKKELEEKLFDLRPALESIAHIREGQLILAGNRMNGTISSESDQYIIRKGQATVTKWNGRLDAGLFEHNFLESQRLERVFEMLYGGPPKAFRENHILMIKALNCHAALRVTESANDGSLAKEKRTAAMGILVRIVDAFNDLKEQGPNREPVEDFAPAVQELEDLTAFIVKLDGENIPSSATDGQS